jgi:hypothetical protein
MSEAEYDELVASFQKAQNLIQKGQYEQSMEYLEKCDGLALKFPSSQLLYETRRMISLCKLLQGQFREYVYERELAAEEIERLEGFDEAGEIYKELADILQVTDNLNLARKYYLLAASNFNRWAKRGENDVSPPEAWEAWALVCRGEAEVALDQRITAFAEAAQKFDQASLKKVKFKNFYRAKELFLEGRISILENCASAHSFNEEGIKRAEDLFAHAYLLDPILSLANICSKIFGGLRLFRKSEKEAQSLLEKSNELLGELAKPGLSRKLSSLLHPLQLAGAKGDLASFCKAIEEVLTM